MSKFKKVIAFFLSLPYFAQTPCSAAKDLKAMLDNNNRRITGNSVLRDRLNLYNGSYNSRNRVAQRRRNNIKNMRYQGAYNDGFNISNGNRKEYGREYIDSVLKHKGVDVNEIKNKSKSEAIKYLLGFGLPITFIVIVVSVYCVYNLTIGKTYTIGDYKVKIEKRLGNGVQGEAYLCTSVTDGQRYVLKSVEEQYAEGYNDPRASERLACDRLKNVNCEYIAKPLAYSTINGQFYVLYEFAEKYDWKFGEMSPEKKKEFFVELIKQLLIVRKKYAELGIRHGDFKDPNLAIGCLNDKPRIRVFDNGYCFSMKKEYSQHDASAHVCPFTDVMHLYLTIHYYINKFSIKAEEQKNLELAVKDLNDKYFSSLLGPDKFYNHDARLKFLKEIAQVTDKQADEFVSKVEEWLDNLAKKM